MKKIAMIGSALSGNKGAAAMLESAMQTLGEKYPDAQFTLLAMYPQQDKEQNTYKNLTILRGDSFYLGAVINSWALLYRLLPGARNFIKKRSPEVKALAEADVLLDQGGITFVDGREVFLIYNVATILPALNVKTPVAKCAQALGPFKNPINRMAANIFLPKMARIVSRGAITHAHLEGLGLKNVTEGADYAFCLEVTDAEEKAATKKFDMNFFKNGNVVGVSPSVVLRKKVDKHRGPGAYAKETAEFVDYLTKEKGYKVLLIPHSYRSAETQLQHNNDAPLCRDIYAQVSGQEKCQLLDVELGSQELRCIIGKCDLFIASRFHAMVSSLAMQVPTLVIGWSHKYREVLEMFGLEKWAFGHDKLQHEYLKTRFAELEEEQKTVRAQLTKKLPKVKKKSYNQVDVIQSVLER
ncbi:polysaccharide pyruvyl transferase WcaK-like protein [Lipingzhangella halophila]|uniref:Polysaccharide pyruvyl transferase WcaK-like protein n=1 Tax=Lipingzhangella halophila TaxID=1783352 RepID=A0A7W7RJK4_9ACTN|nr:polysaccharide pyruvyl transferase family protein [Lipingzhangella halophila]MBB4933159.1 polysaccharide pyruvyl transferase WcaK-like protein [Lipingzhangella halophila]